MRYIGLSEAAPGDIRRAAAVAPIATLQSEYSLFERHLERDTLELLEQLGIGLLPYSPLSRGMLTGRIRSRTDLEEHDARNTWPRFLEGNLEHNLELVDRIEAIAAEKGCTPGQLALAWLLAKRPWIVPIPGTKRIAYLEENVAAAELELTAKEVARLEEVVPAEAVAGERYPADRMPTWASPALGD